MNSEQLEKAKTVSSQIEAAKRELRYWGTSVSFYGSTLLRVPATSANSFTDARVEISPETFTVVKALNIVHFQQILSTLEKEFSEI